jgi:hypothetical protein
MARNVKINEYTGQFENPAVQLNTSVTQIFNEGIELPTNEDMQFTSDIVKDYAPLGDNCIPFQIFKVDDPLTYRKFDPKKIKQMRDQSKQGEQSAVNADKLNPSIS